MTWYIYISHIKMLNALSAVSCGLFTSKKIQEVLVLKTLKYTKKRHSPKALNKTTLSASEMINNLPCWICFDWRQMDFVECVLLWGFFQAAAICSLWSRRSKHNLWPDNLRHLPPSPLFLTASLTFTLSTSYCTDTPLHYSTNQVVDY